MIRRIAPTKKTYEDESKANSSQYQVVRYALTIKLLKTGLTEEQYCINYTVLMSSWRLKYPNVKLIYMMKELDKHDILHLHGVMEAPKNFKYLKLREKGFNISIQGLFDPEGWMKYATNNYYNEPFMKCLEPVLNYEAKLPYNLMTAEVETL